MGRRGRRGGIKRHLDDLKAAVRAWLDELYQNELSQAQQDLRLLRLTQQFQTKPELPEPLELLYMLRNLGVPYRDGGLEQQPYLQVLELNLCVETEAVWRQDFALLRALESETATNANQSGLQS